MASKLNKSKGGRGRNPKPSTELGKRTKPAKKNRPKRGY